MIDYYAAIRSRNQKRSRLSRIFRNFLFILLLLAIYIGYQAYKSFYSSNIWLNGKKMAFIYIPTKASYDDVKAILYLNGLIVNRNSFEWMARIKQYASHIKPGRYKISEGMNNSALINKLRSGNQDAVNLVFNNIRNKEQLAGRISKEIEADSASIINLLNDSLFVANFGMTPRNVITLFIPNTYQVYWNITANDFVERMAKEYKKFWNESRKGKLGEIRLSRTEVMTLASIVEKETNRNDEKPDVAGVYINRLHNGWLLQADPTLVFALGDFSIKRVLNEYKRINSPYNTYMYIGLPPGPICLPSISSIDAVLNYRKHNYMYFCAREDFSGYHNFAVNAEQHQLNANRYQQALNKRNIMK
ncbi:MAG: endolytic transglycosylase MltG [Bacteroidales bacterium]